MRAMKRVPIDVTKGFLSSMSPEFVARCGAGSRLVLAAADHVTETTARMQKRTFLIPDDAPVAQVGEPRAKECLRRLLVQVPEAANVFALTVSGNLPAAALEEHCDRERGAGFFERWRALLEAGRWDEADAALG
jgi:hypothetical protein